MSLQTVSEDARSSIMRVAAGSGGLSPYNVNLPMKAVCRADGKHVLVNGTGGLLGHDASAKPEDAPERMWLDIPVNVRPLLMSSAMSLGAVSTLIAEGLYHDEDYVAYAYGKLMDLQLAELEWMPLHPVWDGQGEDAIEFGRKGYDDPYNGTSKANDAGKIVYVDRYISVLGVLIDYVLVPHLNKLNGSRAIPSSYYADALLNYVRLGAGSQMRWATKSCF